MSDLRINQVSVGPVHVVPLRANVSLDAARAAVSKDGMDEVFVEQSGERFVAFGDRLDLTGIKKSGVQALQLNGQPAILLSADDEVNSMAESLQKNGKKVAIVAGVGVGVGAVVAGAGYLMGISSGGFVKELVNGLMGGGMMVAGGGIAAAGLLGAGGVAAASVVRGGRTPKTMAGIDQIKA